jgi:hypothetical protein
MGLRRRQPPQPCPCGCLELAERLAEYETTTAAITGALIALRPILPGHSVERGLAGWGVRDEDAAILARAYRKARGR